ncbi:MAG: DUF2281 domain-containing protein [Tunicatimonas sp.]|uniref:DUF2281 domain-containing protein n=1 Tax=Tunicatimonas sp. TaxID=1940096 RepID=UPI003C77B33D
MSAIELKTKIRESIEHLSEELNKKASQLNKPEKRGLVGCMKGVVTYMADDFNEPMEDFREYMPD